MTLPIVTRRVPDMSGAYRTIQEGYATFVPIATVVTGAGIYVPSAATAAVAVAGAAGSARGIFCLSDAYAVSGRTTMLRLAVGVAVENVAPGQDLTVGLYPVTAVGGTVNNGTATLGTVVTGSTAAFASAALTANAINLFVNSTDFAFPTAGWYVVGIATPGAWTANCGLVISTQLQVRNVV